jgi:hypothetical protein
MTTLQEVLGKVLFALTERQKGNVIRSEDEYIDEARALLQSADSGEQEAPYSAPFTTDVAHCCGEPDHCNDPCEPEKSK